MPYVGSLTDIPAGWYLCDGTNGTPDLQDRFLEGSNVPNIFIEPGLPNIKGTAFGMQYGREDGTGSFYRMYSGTTIAGANGSGYIWGFDASLSNPIYGASTTIQPAAYTVYYIIRLK